MSTVEKSVQDGKWNIQDQPEIPTLIAAIRDDLSRLSFAVYKLADKISRVCAYDDLWSPLGTDLRVMRDEIIARTREIERLTERTKL